MDIKCLALVFCFLVVLGTPSPVRRSTVRPQPGLCSLQGRALPPCQRWHKIDRNGCCRPCKCHKGKGKKLSTQDPCKEKCKPCIAKETFNQHFDYFCKSCQTCGANEVVVQQCTVSSDTVCHAMYAFV
ncbi:uncharacterized protein LOC106164199 [Lingula anatina]|uniref:Uncharacterized protein LOC106164199 n=1 Tax=Lingula anatina TaxID=7574 RepID=A0A1S3IH62_LINAN|nr:uncharacterized protein LOC106164199 [Lingula anatina]|eukprot:XP_013397468.1 uncharacterized protein LOC106164199 [Lingula anatina]